jgi:hypothetical protein
MMVAGRSGPPVARFLECLSCLLQPFPNRPLGGLGSMLHSLAGGACRMLNRLAGLCRSFLYGIASFFNWTLILRSHPEGCAKQQNSKKRQMSHSNLRASSY